ncbi:BrnA antitoxin family protein [Brucella pseudogrignonensis]|nr:BrnA antitoxin family protein [Brucella pseudogrignonensis]
MTKEDMKRAKPFKEALPELYESIQRSRGRPKVDNPKEAVTLRLDPDVVEKFKANGKNWRANMNDALRKAVGL